MPDSLSPSPPTAPPPTVQADIRFQNLLSGDTVEIKNVPVVVGGEGELTYDEHLKILDIDGFEVQEADSGQGVLALRTIEHLKVLLCKKLSEGLGWAEFEDELGKCKVKKLIPVDLIRVFENKESDCGADSGEEGGATTWEPVEMKAEHSIVPNQESVVDGHHGIGVQQLEFGFLVAASEDTAPGLQGEIDKRLEQYASRIERKCTDVRCLDLSNMVDRTIHVEEDPSAAAERLTAIRANFRNRMNRLLFRSCEMLFALCRVAIFRGIPESFVQSELADAALRFETEAHAADGIGLGERNLMMGLCPLHFANRWLDDKAKLCTSQLRRVKEEAQVVRAARGVIEALFLCQENLVIQKLREGLERTGWYTNIDKFNAGVIVIIQLLCSCFRYLSSYTPTRNRCREMLFSDNMVKFFESSRSDATFLARYPGKARDAWRELEHDLKSVLDL